MNTPSPLVPQGATTEPRRRSHLTAVFVILFLHVGALSVLLLQGCGKNETPPPTAEVGNPPILTLDTNPPPAIADLPPASPFPPPPGVPSGATPTPGLNPNLPNSFGTLPPSPSLPPSPTLGLPPVTAPAPFDVASSTPSTEHTVMRGETGAVIAKKYGMGWKAIEAANPGVDSRKLKIGQKLMIPAKSIAPSPAATHDTAAGSLSSVSTSVHTVKSGDTLGKIAKSQGVTIKAIKAANGLKLDAIKVGQKLKIPGKPAANVPTQQLQTPGPRLRGPDQPHLQLP